MSAAPAFASVGEAIDMARAALGYLAAVDATQLAAETQAECLRGLERTDAIATAARASFLSAFTAGKGYSADADYSARVVADAPDRDHPGRRRRRIPRGPGGPAPIRGWWRRWPRRSSRSPYGRAICQWTDQAAGEAPGGVRRAAARGRGGQG